jgi:hypothetical protein
MAQPSIDNSKYSLDVYVEPGDKTPLIGFESDTPFVAVNKGDLLHTGGWAVTGIGAAKLRVERVEHFIGQKEGRGLAFQKVLVFTQRVEK